jgi:hypothetical protein
MPPPAAGPLAGAAAGPVAETGAGRNAAPSIDPAQPSNKKTMGPVVDPNFVAGFKLITLISPFFLVFLLVTISIINSDIKGFIYLGGVLFLFAVMYLIAGLIPMNNLSGTCALWNIGLFQTPSFISALYVFTIVYLVYPMVLNQIFNFPLIVILLVIYISDIIIRAFKMGCTNLIHVTIGSVMGLVVSFFVIVLLGNHKNLLYFNDTLSSKVACSVPSKQKFKCSVYNNGQLVQSISPS